MACTLGCLIEEDIVTPKCLAQRFCIWTCQILLPIQPPEINAFALMVTNDVLEERLSKVGVIKAPIDIIAAVIQVLAT